MSAADHWDAAYARGAERVSWYQDDPAPSLEMIDALGLVSEAAIVDVGGGASTLVDALLQRGYRNVTVVDISQSALATARGRLGALGGDVQWVCADLLEWQPACSFDVWHDRAVLHFLTDPADREAYRQRLMSAVPTGGHVVIATFAPDGPETCSGLPVRRYSTADVLEFLGPSFALASERREVHATPSGSTQSFTWVCARRQS